eukprot:SAG31_NODE_5214_length_2671_cov_1.306376_4_plen_64_part_00
MKENAMKGAIDDDFDEAVLSEEVQGVFEPNRKAVLKVRPNRWDVFALHTPAKTWSAADLQEMV